MSGPSTEDPAMPSWPAWTYPEARVLADLYRANYGVVPDHVQDRVDELEQHEQDRLTRRELLVLRDELDDA